MMVFISKVNNYMFRPKAAIFRLLQLQFCSKSVIYMSVTITMQYRHHYAIQAYIYDTL